MAYGIKGHVIFYDLEKKRGAQWHATLNAVGMGSYRGLPL
jgi:hypothetical protein